MMYKIFPEGHPHGRSAERDARHTQAASHPDATDLQHASEFARNMVQKMKEA